MTYCVNVRKLALRMVKKCGVMKTSELTNISRSSLWRWKLYGVDPKRRAFESKLFEQITEVLRCFLENDPCTAAKEIVYFLRAVHCIHLSRKTASKFIRKLGLSRKRARTRGKCKGDLGTLVGNFCYTYKQAVHEEKTVGSLDECGFSKRLKPLYGYSPIGQPLIIKTSGSWVNHSLLMAVFSDGQKAHMIKKGAIKRDDFV